MSSTKTRHTSGEGVFGDFSVEFVGGAEAGTFFGSLSLLFPFSLGVGSPEISGFWFS